MGYKSNCILELRSTGHFIHVTLEVTSYYFSKLSQADVPEVAVVDDEHERVDQSPTVQFQNNLSMALKCAEQSNLIKISNKCRYSSAVNAKPLIGTLSKRICFLAVDGEAIKCKSLYIFQECIHIIH